MLVAKKNEIKARRLALEFSQRKLSLLAGLPENAICRVENGKFNYIYPIRAKAIAKALGCTIHDVFEEVGGGVK